MALSLATSSPFNKSHILNNMAYYFDDNRIAIGSIEINNHYEIVSLIMNKIDHEFKVIVKEKE